MAGLDVVTEDEGIHLKSIGGLLVGIQNLLVFLGPGGRWSVDRSENVCSVRYD